MSAGLPYLSKLKKSELSEFAETTNLPDYSGLKKADLEVALDEHLRANQTTYAKEDSLSAYYQRLGPRSPAKRITEAAKSEGEPVVKKVRRKTQAAVDQATTATSDAEGTFSSLVKTPARDLVRASASYAQSVPLPASPGDVADVIDQQSRRFSASISKAYERSGIHEYSDTVRDLLSSPLAINVIALLVELYGLRARILPNKHISLPAIPYFTKDHTVVPYPGLFALVEPNFWAPFSLWSLTSVILPLAIAYFINIPLKISHAHPTRRRAAIQEKPLLQFDPVIFNVAKALIAYLVYAQQFDLFGLYQQHTISTVDVSVFGGYAGMITSAGIAGLVALYEAVLKK